MSEVYKANKLSTGALVKGGVHENEMGQIYIIIIESRLIDPETNSYDLFTDFVEVDPATLVQVSGKAVDRVKELEHFIKTIVDCENSKNEYKDDGSNAYYWRLGIIELSKEALKEN